MGERLSYLPYTGVGSRETPQFFLSCMEEIGARLCARGYTLRSGAANGADSAFELGCNRIDERRKEIFLPWAGFNGSRSTLCEPPEQAYVMACDVYSSWTDWSRLRPTSKVLHARNCQQVLGERLDSPSKFLVCWTMGGQPVGGTATAIKLAHKHNIPVLNLGAPENEISSTDTAWKLVIGLLGST